MYDLDEIEKEKIDCPYREMDKENGIHKCTHAGAEAYYCCNNRNDKTCPEGRL